MVRNRFAIALLGAATLLFAGALRASPPQAIYGGGQVSPCAWPTTVSLGGCTGTLVHPELVVTAAHCMEGGGPTSAVFGDRDDAPAIEVATLGCQADPQYGAVGGHDVAYCKLAQPVTNVPIVPILMGCETDVLQPGVDVIAVGFGEADDNLGWGPKRQVTMKLNGISDGEAFIGGNGKDTCYGDSGGSVFVKLGDGSYRVFGVTSYGEYCGAGGYYSMMHTAIAWLEQSSGLDLTPCFDNGAWQPGPGCGGFPLDPDVGGGSWSSGCATGKVSGPSATCGASGGGSGGAGGTGGDAGSGGTAGASGASGGTTSYGGSTSTVPGCSADPDCGACVSCLDQCRCLTGEAQACVSACAPGSGADPNAGAPAAPVRTSAPPSMEGSCALAPPTASDWGVLLLGGLALAALGRRR